MHLFSSTCFLPVGPNVPISTLLQTARTLWSSSWARDEASHACRKASRIIFLCILICALVDRRILNWKQQAFPDFSDLPLSFPSVCLNFYFVGYLTTVVSSETYIVLVGRMVSEWCIWKGFGRIRSWPKRGTISELEGLSNITETLIQYGWCLSRDSNQASPEYQSRAFSLDQNVQFVWTRRIFIIAHLYISFALLWIFWIKKSTK
jgi:hypothetical protein